MDVISGVISCKQPCIDLASGSMDDSCSTEYAFSSPFPKAWSLALLQRFFNLLLLLPTLPFSISSTMEWNNTMRGFSCLSAEWLWQTHKSTRDKKEEIWRQQIWTHQAYKKNRRKHSPQALENGNPEKRFLFRVPEIEVNANGCVQDISTFCLGIDVSLPETMANTVGISLCSLWSWMYFIPMLLQQRLPVQKKCVLVSRCWGSLQPAGRPTAKKNWRERRAEPFNIFYRHC